MLIVLRIFFYEYRLGNNAQLAWNVKIMYARVDI